MDEIDGIILHNLRAVGCDIDEEVSGLHGLSVELVVEAAVRCLKSINPETNISYKLPPSMAARFRIGTDIATAVKELGFKGDIGYHTFLYSNEIEVRRVLMFLIDRLPKEQVQDNDAQALGSLALLQSRIADVMSKRLASAWILPQLRVKTRGVSSRDWCTCTLSLPLSSSQQTSPDEANYYRLIQPVLYNQPRRHDDMNATAMESNVIQEIKQREREQELSATNAQESRARKRQKVIDKISDLLRESIDRTDVERWRNDERIKPVNRTKASLFTRSEKLQFTPDDAAVMNQIGTGGSVPSDDINPEVELAQKLEHLKELEGGLKELNSRYDELQDDISRYSQGIRQMRNELAGCKSDHTNKQQTLETKERTIHILPTAESTISQLQSAIESSEQRLASFADQWDQHRIPLEQRLKKLKDLTASRLLETQRKADEIRVFQERLKELTVESREKEELCKQLEIEYQRMTKDVNRTAYTRRILEIVSNIRKQNQDIDKVLIDTKDVQKEINSLSGRLDRTFIVTDELIFKDAKRDEAARKAYKYLAALHENCDILVKTIEETGAITREIKDLEDMVETESKKKTDESLEQILSDFDQMKKENSDITAKLKQSLKA